MNWKNKIRAFSASVRRADGGFTLVELIVTIAIMATLAGVGTAGYSGYIKSANKGADKTLVGNVMRAIETGTNSMMFKPSNSMQISATTYPVGFVVLTTDGAQLLTSSTQTTEAAGACEFKAATVAKLTTADVKKTCGLTGSATKTVTTISYEEINYCTVHGAIPAALDADTPYVTEFSGCSGSGWHSHEWVTNTTTLPKGTLVADSQVRLQSANDSALCEYAYANQYGGFTGANSVAGTNGDPDTSHALYQALEAAFGDLSSLKLSYDGWSSEGIDYATFYASAPGLMEDMEGLTGKLVLAYKAASLVNMEYKLKLGGTYASSEEVLAGVSKTITETHTEASWLEQWNNDAKMTWGSYGFNLAGTENYCAARMAYNNAFASYMEANGQGTYAEQIRNFYSTSAEDLLGIKVDLGLPGLVCTNAFTDSASPLPQKLKDAGATDEDIKALQKLYKEYINSNACTENGKVVYRTLSTFNETIDVANAYVDMNGGDIYDYYNSYVDEISKMYTEAQAAADDGIVIIVTVEDGVVTCDVSPSAANPRND